MIVSISAIVLTKNEVNNLSRCIHSLQWCDETIIIDSGSTDGTCELASKLNLKVFTHIQTGLFKISEQRNWALKNCNLQGDWILFVDADETIPDELSFEIVKTCSDLSHSYNAYELTPRYLFWGKWLKRTQGYPNWHPRLIKKDEVYFTGGVWEQFSSNANVGRIYNPYNHYANSKGFSDWLERHDRYSSWDACKVVDFLETQHSSVLETNRKLRLRILAAKFWMFRPIARFLHMYFFRLGFLEGSEALCFCLMYSFYELMIVIKIIEIQRKKMNLSL